jgi:pimeloyl-ACP methyl ester carboxylesterase
MSRRLLTPLPAVLLITGALVAARSPEARALTSAPCAGATSFTCSTVAVPLDRQIASPSTIELNVARKPATGGPSSSAVIALAGGPGQAALPLAEYMAKAIAPALKGRDLVVFDQRGTGSSDPLSCAALDSLGTVGSAFEHCALELGSPRGGFTTEESVEDIEAIRRAYGYTKLVLYGTSYGTKVALAYAARFPGNVEALVLDSVVTTNGPEPFAIPTFEAISPVLEELCSEGACDGITTHAVTDIAHLNAKLRKRALSGSVYDGSGHRHAAVLDEVGLLEILEAGDLNPALRALLPAAVQSALRHDPDPLLRLHLLSEGLIPNIPNSSSEESAGEGADGIDEALFVTTSCEELPFPWQRGSSPQTRLAEAFGFLHAQPSGDFYPFASSTAVESSLVVGCSAWPDASPAPPVTQVLPDVPTLILSGAQDLRTPTANARAVAAEIPDAQVEVVPYTGHSVLGSDLSGCAERAVSEFFAATPVQPCAAAKNVFSPTPIVPSELSQVHTPRVLSGNPGKTLAATLDTILDLQRQIIGATLQADGELPNGSSFGGLRGGYARLTSTRAILKKLSFVSGVRISGSFPVSDGALQTATVYVSGTAASAGTITVSPSDRVTGTLGGRHFSVDLATIKLSRAGPGEWPSNAIELPLGGPQELLSAHAR